MWSLCGPFRRLLRPLCGRKSHEQPRKPTNTVPAPVSIFAPLRQYSRLFANMRNIGAPGFEPGTSPTRTVRATRLRHAPMRLAVFHSDRARLARSIDSLGESWTSGPDVPP